MIKIYTTPNCSYCDRAKKFFANEGIEFEAVDITEDEDAMKLMREKGFMGVPVIEINGNFLQGFSEKMVLEALNL